MKKTLRALILTLGILATTGISSAAYAQECNTVKPTESLQSICAKYGIDASKCLTVKFQGTNACKVTIQKTTPCKTTLCKITPVKTTPTKAVPAKSVPGKSVPAKAVPTKAVPAKTTPAKTTTTSSSAADRKLVQEVITLVNQERAKQGLAPLKENVKLSSVAKIKSGDMVANNYFDHTSPTYGSPFDMMKKFGITYTAAGENIAMGQPTAASVMSAWMNSPGHRANILSKNFTEIGVGIARDKSGTIYWTQQFIGK